MSIFEVCESAGWGGRHAVLTREVPSTGKLLLFEEPLAVLKPDFSFDGAFPSSGDEVGSGDACNSRVCPPNGGTARGGVRWRIEYRLCPSSFCVDT